MIHEVQYSTGDVLRLSKHESVNFRFPIHLHKSFELVFVKEGTLTVTIGTREYRASAGEGVLIFPGEPHAYDTEHYSRIVIEIFSHEYLSSLYSEYRAGIRHEPVFRFDEAQFPQELLQSKSDRYMLMSLLYRVASAYVKGATVRAVDTKDEHLVCQIVSYMDDHFTEDLTLHALATHFGYNYRYMSGLFREIYGTSFPTALHFKRIALAKELLGRKSGSISEISERCGYRSERSFHRNFKEIEGCSPREYMARKG